MALGVVSNDNWRGVGVTIFTMPVGGTRIWFFQPVRRRFQRLLKLQLGFETPRVVTAYEPEEPAGAGLLNEPVGLLIGVALPSAQGLVVLVLS